MSKEAIEHYEAALKEAFPSGATGDVFHHWNEARKALAEQPAQQEPKKDLMWSTVAMQERHDQRIQKVVATLEQIKQEQLAEQPAQQQKPVAIVASHPERVDWLRDEPPDGTLLYTFPPASKPLTDEQILHLVDIHVGAPSMAYPLDTSDWLCFARAIEAAHGIKEQP